MKKIAAVLLLVLLAAGCAKTPAQTAKTEQMPQDFAICFAWWYNLEQKNSMDTATGKLQKDLLVRALLARRRISADGKTLNCSWNRLNEGMGAVSQERRTKYEKG